MPLLISGATIIDGLSAKPIEGHSLWIEGARIKAIGPRDELGVPPGAQVIDSLGKYVIPGLMNANVHLLMDIRLENLARYLDRYEELIIEAAQVALKNGLTTVFDTYGPRRFLMAARDRINAGKATGSRIFCAGNIIGLDGPFSQDFEFFAKGMGSASVAFARRINAIWVENVGRHLMWLTPEQVGQEVRSYIRKGIDFLKYASNDHVPGGFLAFSPPQQEAIVEEAHRAGITAQAHTMSVEGLRIAVEAGCDLMAHANATGPIPIPERTLELMVRRKTGAVVFPQTQRRLDQLMKDESYIQRGPKEWQAIDTNVRNLIRCGAQLMLANDGCILAPEVLSNPTYASVWKSEDNLYDLAGGHFYWFRAMQEKGCSPMEMLKAATRNIAVAYGRDNDLGTLERGKIADLLVLDKNPLEAAENYRSIHMIVKDGAPVDRDALPLNPILTRPMESPVEEEASYVTYLSSGKFPPCPACSFRFRS